VPPLPQNPNEFQQHQWLRVFPFGIFLVSCCQKVVIGLLSLVFWSYNPIMQPLFENQISIVAASKVVATKSKSGYQKVVTVKTN
jgi:hypothetical protein